MLVLTECEFALSVVCITLSFTLCEFMYGVVIGAFAVLTGILFGFRAKRKSEERKSAAPASTSGEERKGAI